MPFKRLADALRDGVVDGYENAWSNVRSRGLHQLRPNFTETGHSYLGYMVVTSNQFWDKLPSDIRLELNAILDEVTVEVNRLALEKNQTDREFINETGLAKIVTLNSQEKQLWKEAMTPIWEEYREEIGSDVITAAQSVKLQDVKVAGN